MKHQYIPAKFLALTFMLFLFMVSCDDDDDYMKSEIKDMNGNIQSVDKEIAQPGDVVTFTGTGLDKVYKIMLNTDNVPVEYDATATELKMTVPALSPLGDVITISLFFSGKGLAQRAIQIISPPVILAFVPSAAQPGDVVTLYGRELYLAQHVFVGSTEVTSTLEVIDDRTVSFVFPEGSAGGDIKIVTATGGESLSASPLVQGTEILITDFDGHTNYYTGLSSNGNLDQDKEETGEFPRNKYYTFTLVNNNQSWGGNVDFYFSGQPAYDNAKISLSVDVKVSKNMNVNIMVEGPGMVYGLTKPVSTDWQTIVIPFSEMGTDYSGSAPFGQVAAFNTLKGVKIQPPASPTSGNFGESISIDNVKFIIAN